MLRPVPSRRSHISPVRNGLVSRSWPMLEPAPWPQMKPTSSPSGSSLSVIDLIAWRGCRRGGRLRPTETVEQHVADMGKAHFLVEEHHAAGRMTGAVQDVEGQRADRNLIAFVEASDPPREIAHAGHAEPRAAGDGVVEQMFIGDVRAFDRHFQRIAQFGGRRRHGRYGHGSARIFSTDTWVCLIAREFRDVAAGVDHHGLFGGFRTQITVQFLLKQRTGTMIAPALAFGLGFGLGLLCHVSTSNFLRPPTALC